MTTGSTAVRPGLPRGNVPWERVLNSPLPMGAIIGTSAGCFAVVGAVAVGVCGEIGPDPDEIRRRSRPNHIHPEDKAHKHKGEHGAHRQDNKHHNGPRDREKAHHSSTHHQENVAVTRTTAELLASLERQQKSLHHTMPRPPQGTRQLEPAPYTPTAADGGNYFLDRQKSLSLVRFALAAMCHT